VAPNPVVKFEESSLPKYLVEQLKEFDRPTAIQAQTWPILL
jgi:superfamily II DNA/RNA helicase